MKRHGRALAALLVGLLAAVVLLLPLIRAGLHKLELARYPQKFQDLVEHYAQENQLDPLVLYSVIRTESGFDPKAESNVGARGLMQITEETFWWIKSKIAPKEELDFDDLYDPETNIRFGAYYFAACLKRYENDLSTAAAAYHSGWGTVDRLLEEGDYTADGIVLHTFPYEQMKLYVYKITHAFQKYQELYSSQEIEG